MKIYHLPQKAFLKKKNENIIDFIPLGIIFNYTNISKNPHISSKKKTSGECSLPGCDDNFAVCITSGKVPCRGSAWCCECR